MGGGFDYYSQRDNALLSIYIIVVCLGIIFGVIGAVMAFKKAQTTEDKSNALILGSASIVGIVFWPVGIVCGIVALFTMK